MEPLSPFPAFAFFCAYYTLSGDPAARALARGSRRPGTTRRTTTPDSCVAQRHRTNICSDVQVACVIYESHESHERKEREKKHKRKRGRTREKKKEKREAEKRKARRDTRLVPAQAVCVARRINKSLFLGRTLHRLHFGF
jgi:hypothetical protein